METNYQVSCQGNGQGSYQPIGDPMDGEDNE